MWKARELREMAMKGRNLEKVVNSQDSTIDLLETSVRATHKFYWDQMADLNKQLENQTAVSGRFANLYRSEREEKEYYIGREKKQRKKKNILGGALVVVVILTLIK